MAWNARVNFSGRLFSGPVTPEIKTALRLTLPDALSIIRASTPVDTGRMRASWTGDIRGDRLNIRNSAPYSYWVEHGTRRMAARAPLGSNLDRIVSIFKGHLTDTVTKSLGSKGRGGSFKSTVRRASTANRVVGLEQVIESLPTRL